MGTLGDNLLKLTEFPFSYSLISLLVLISGGGGLFEDASLEKLGPLLILMGFVATTLSITDPIGALQKLYLGSLISGLRSRDKLAFLIFIQFRARSFVEIKRELEYVFRNEDREKISDLALFMRKDSIFRRLATTIDPIGFEHTQHFDFLSTHLHWRLMREANMWHRHTILSSVRDIHNSKITYERRTMQWQKINHR
jgi:hypothetical protein